MKKNKTQIILVIILIILGFSARLLPHPANFTPIGAIALFAGLYLTKKWAYMLPIAAMLFSDMFIGFYNWKIMASVYIGFIIMVVFGLIVKKRKSFSNILLGTLYGSIIFFLMTNAAVWLFGTLYPHTVSGLAQCYLMAIPFFKNSLLGNLFYSTILIGTMESIIYYANKIRVKQEI